MNTRWKINLEGFEKYRLDTDGNIWRLPYQDKGGKYYEFRRLKMCRMKNRWALNIKGKICWWSQNQLRPHLIDDDSPIPIFTLQETPW